MIEHEGFLGIEEFADKTYYSERQVRQLCIDGKIKGAFKLTDYSRKWLIPASAIQEFGKTKTPSNWIEDHIAKNGQPPSAPEWMLAMLGDYVRGQPLKKTTKWVYPSTQLWFKILLPSHREKWLQFIEWQGGNREDFCEEIERCRPPGGNKPFRLIPKRKIKSTHLKIDDTGKETWDIELYP